MKKLLTGIVLGLSLCACGGGGQTPNNSVAGTWDGVIGSGEDALEFYAELNSNGSGTFSGTAYEKTLGVSTQVKGNSNKGTLQIVNPLFEKPVFDCEGKFDGGSYIGNCVHNYIGIDGPAVGEESIKMTKR